MRAVVIGGTGFLGLNICLALRNAGHDVKATRRRSSNTLLVRRLRIPTVPADLDAPDSLEKALSGSDVVFMAAGHYPRFSVESAAQEALGTRRLLNAVEAATRAGAERFIYTSSSAAVAAGRAGEPAREAYGWPTPHEASTYFRVKVAMERALVDRRPSAGGGPEVVTLCPTGCLGPYDWKVGTSAFVLGVLRQTPLVYVDGHVNVVDVRDVAQAHVTAARCADAGDRYLLGGHDTTLSALLQTMAQRFGVPLNATAVSADDGYRLAAAEEARCRAAGRGRPALFREFVDLAVYGCPVDDRQARIHLAHAPRPLAQTLDDAANWFRTNGYLRSSDSNTAPAATVAAEAQLPTRSLA